jgi:hypothetical protein
MARPLHADTEWIPRKHYRDIETNRTATTVAQKNEANQCLGARMSDHCFHSLPFQVDHLTKFIPKRDHW